MQKATVSFLIGLMVIVIIIESTALSSTFPTGRVSNVTPPPVVSSVQNLKSAVDTQDVVQPTLVSASPTRNTVTGNSQLAPIQKASTTEIPTIAPVAPVRYVQYDDPIPDSDDDSSSIIHASYFPEVTLPPVNYVDIFHEDQSFLYNSSAISFKLVNPPMKISYNVTPQMLIDEKWVMNRAAGKKTTDGLMLNVTRFDENSWFHVTVFDKSRNGTIVLQDGFGNGYDQALTKEILIRDPGNYQLKFDGNHISVDTLVSVPEDGNILT